MSKMAQAATGADVTIESEVKGIESWGLKEP